MKERILKFMQIKQLSSQKFATEVAVQPSGISHILSGRNKPSFDFIQKVLLKYPELNAEWLILGKGDMFKSTIQSSLFEEKNDIQDEIKETKSEKELETIDLEPKENIDSSVINKNNIEKLFILYKNGTFKEYRPEN